MADERTEGGSDGRQAQVDVQFLGSMNAFPMMYAIEFQGRGHRISYLVDVPVTEHIHRPECHYPTVTHPYGPGMVERYFRWRPWHWIFPAIAALELRRSLRSARLNVLSGWYVMLAPFLCRTSRCVHLSYGSDLSTYCDPMTLNNEAILQRVPLPRTWKRWVRRRIVQKMRSGAHRCAAIIYFPKGLEPQADRVIGNLAPNGPRRMERFDVSEDPTRGIPLRFKEGRGPLSILIGTRIDYLLHKQFGQNESKGNDIIVRALAVWREQGHDFTVDLFNRGQDVEPLRALIMELGLSDRVRWHESVPLRTLLEQFYTKADICFDQVGTHWMGAIGAYALYLGKPLIVNARLDVFAAKWPQQVPFHNAATVDEVVAALDHFAVEGNRRRAFQEGPGFARRWLSPRQVVDELEARYLA